jgi:DNA-binding MarR family transcriptional regulator/N-acetylglutamate synthase-like GNAT family acetyltransferase
MSLGRDVARVRAFNRFYTSRIGVLMQRPYGSHFSLTETRVLYEIVHRDGVQPGALARELGLDPAYLSRILTRFRKLGLAEQRTSEEDRRSLIVRATDVGRAVLAPLEEASDAAVGELLASVSPAARRKLVSATAAIERALAGRDERQPGVAFRDLAVGDVGWITHRQALLYAQEYGWDASYEALVADILGRFVREFDPAREKAWIAERGGEILGSVLLVKTDAPEAGKLRLLYVEPTARGQGLGARLVQLCIEGARRRGYRRLELWTNDVLVSARRIYEAAGFELVAEEPHHSFGKDLVGQTWRLAL